jgi:serine/threonine protein kinase
MAQACAITRRYVEAHTVEYYRTAGGTRPDLRVVETEDGRIVVKDFWRSDLPFRLIVGPILIRREYGALRKLAGVSGVPRLVARIDRYALAVEHVPGVSLDRTLPNALTDEFYAELRRVVDGIHSRGVAHCDLRSRGNVMLGEDGRPCVVDFAACVFLGRGLNPFFKWLFGQFVLADRNAVLRIKQRLSPQLLSDQEKTDLATPLPYERPARFVGESIRRLTRRLLTRRNKRDTID